MALFDKFKNKKRDKNQVPDENQNLPQIDEQDQESEEGQSTPDQALPEENVPVEEAETAKLAEQTESNMETEEQDQPEDESDDEILQKKNKKGIFERFKQGLSKTRQNIGGKIETLIKSTRKLDEEFFEELEEILIQADVGINTSLALVDKIRTAVKKQKINDPLQVTELIKDAIAEIMGAEQVPLNSAPEKPTVILVVGVNGSGKTTSIAKLAYKYKQEKKKVVLAAGDTF